MSTQQNPHTKKPHQCEHCGNIIREDEDYCEDCWADIEDEAVNRELSDYEHQEEDS